MFQTAKTALVVLSAIVCVIPTAAMAVTNFTGGGTDDFFNPVNWDNGVPGEGNNGFISNGGYANNPTSNAQPNIVGYTLTLNDGTLDPSPNKSSWMLQNAHIVQNGGTYRGGINLGWASGVSSYTLNDGDHITNQGHLHIGRFGEGIFNQNGGTVTVNAGSGLHIGPTGKGTYNLAGGTVQTEKIQIDYEDENGANGSTFNFTAGSTGRLYMNSSGVINGGIPSVGTVNTIPDLITNGHMTIGGAAALVTDFIIANLTSGPFSGYTEVRTSSDFILGDFNGVDGVDVIDFGILRDNMQGQFEGVVTYSDGDIDFDNDVDLDDFGHFKDLFPAVVAAATGIPEPSTGVLSLWAFVGIAQLARRRRTR